MTNLASDLALLGEVRRAREMGERALELSREVRGPNHHATLAVASNLSLDRRADNDAEFADALFTDTMERLTAELGREHPETRRAAQRGRMNLDIEPMHT